MMIYGMLTHSNPHMRTDNAIDVLGHISQDCLGATTAIEQSMMVSAASLERSPMSDIHVKYDDITGS